MLSIARTLKRDSIIVGILFISQLLNFLQHMIFNPLGPDFTASLHMNIADLGFFTTAYTLFSASIGCLGIFIFDRIDRKKILLMSIAGVSFGTFIGTMAHDFWQMLFIRGLCGAMGGPLSAMVLAVIPDLLPEDRRGRAVGVVMSAFAVSSVVGVPVALQISLKFGWKAPFYVVAMMGLAIFLMMWFFFPAIPAQVSDKKLSPTASIKSISSNPAALISLLSVPTVLAGSYMIIPNFAAFAQFNLHLPRAYLTPLYFYGGIAALLGSQIGGRCCDYFGSFKINVVGTLMLISSFVFCFLRVPPLLSPPIFMSIFMAGLSVRIVSFYTYFTQIPEANYRASFMSAQSVINNLSIGLGAFLASMMLMEDVNKQLIGMDFVAGVAIILSSMTPFLLTRMMAANKT